MRLSKSFLGAALILIGFLGTRPAAALVNGSFEANGGSLDGWTVTLPGTGNPFAGAVASHAAFVPVDTVTGCDIAGPSPFTYFPQDGGFFALLKTDGPGSETKLAQTFSASGGSTLRGFVFFDSGDGIGNDNASLVVKDGNGVVIATLFDKSTLPTIGTGETPWTPFSFIFPANGSFTLEAQVHNTGDDICDSFLGLDAVTLSNGAPALGATSTVALMLLLLGLGAYRLRHARV